MFVAVTRVFMCINPLSITNVFFSGMGVRLIWLGDLAGQTAFSQNEDGKPTTFSSLSPPDKLGAFIDSEFRS